MNKMNNSNLQVLSESERMTNIVIDVESQNETKVEPQPKIESPLRGILKNPEEDIIYNYKVEQRLMKLCLGLLILVIMSPIIFCDLYFGFIDTSCSREQPDELALSVRLYLIVSGFVGLSAMIAILTAITCFDTNKNSETGASFISCISITFICAVLFNIVWNILGAIVFWGYIYGNGNCNRTFSIYVFVSLIIKFVGTLFAGYKLKKKYDQN